MNSYSTFSVVVDVENQFHAIKNTISKYSVNEGQIHKELR